MGRVSILPLVFLISHALLGQQFTAKQNGESLTRTRSTGTSCPIDVEASLSGTPSSMSAGAQINGKPVGHQDSQAEERASRLHLDLSNPSTRDIASAKFTAHGFSRKLRAFDLTDPSNAPDVWKTVDVALDMQGKGHASKDISLSHFTAVMTSIDLDSVVYADGTVWQAPSPGACSTTPNPAIRIASNR